MAAGTVLYVEDEENDAFFVRRAFQKLKLAALEWVNDGPKAIGYLAGDGAHGDRAGTRCRRRSCWT